MKSSLWYYMLVVIACSFFTGAVVAQDRQRDYDMFQRVVNHIAASLGWKDVTVTFNSTESFNINQFTSSGDGNTTYKSARGEQITSTVVWNDSKQHRLTVIIGKTPELHAVRDANGSITYDIPDTPIAIKYNYASAAYTLLKEAICSQASIGALAASGIDPISCSAAAQQLKDQTELAKVAIEGRNVQACLIAVTKLTDNILLTKVALESQFADIRCVAVKTLSDPKLLAKIATEDKDALVRKTAVDYLCDQAVLIKIAFNDMNAIVRFAALRFIEDKTLLAQIAQNDADANVRNAALKTWNPQDGAEMIWVPAGEFMMSSRERYALSRYKIPENKVTLDGFWIYKRIVSVAQYRRFCLATNRKMPEEPKWGWHDNQPIVNVNWTDASAYAKWAKVSLPTEEQWVKAFLDADPAVKTYADNILEWCDDRFGLYKRDRSLRRDATNFLQSGHDSKGPLEYEFNGMSSRWYNLSFRCIALLPEAK